MADDMGTFRVDIEIENPARPGEKRIGGLYDAGEARNRVPHKQRFFLPVLRQEPRRCKTPQ